jgi:hypothetical protein
MVNAIRENTERSECVPAEATMPVERRDREDLRHYNESLADRALHSGPKRIFLLSPANINGVRAKFLLGDNGKSDLALRLRRSGAPLGELFTFLSGLYFRGKLAYAQTFGDAPAGVAHSLVITAGGGLIPPDTMVTLARLREISSASVDPSDARFTEPLIRDARALSGSADESCQVVLLGSIATPKYVDPLLSVLGTKLVFPAEFVGRGDMSRGGLMLRCVQSRTQLTYIPLLDAVRRGHRPPKLQPLVKRLSTLN